MDPNWCWTARRTALALAALTCFALVLRLTGIGFLLPAYWEPDQRVYSTQVELLRRGDPHPELNVDFGWYPLLVARITSLFPPPPPPDRSPTATTLDEHLERASAPRRQIRSVIASISALLVPATYFLARRFLRREHALIAAMLAATSVLSLWYSQQTRPHGVSSALIALALVGALMVRRRGDALAYALAGLACGLAVSTLQSGLAALPPLLVAHVLCRRGRFWVRTLWLLGGLAIALFAVRVFYPFMFMHHGGTGRDATQFGLRSNTFDLSGHMVYLDQFRGRGFAVLAQAFWSYEPLILALAIGGMGMLAARATRGFARTQRTRRKTQLLVLLKRRADACVVLAFAIPFILVFGLYDKTFVRFALPLVPIAAICAAYLIANMTGKTTISVAARRTIRVGFGAALALQAVSAVRLVQIRAQPDTGRIAARWIETNLDREHTHIGVQPGFDVPLLRDEVSLNEYRPTSGYQNYPWLNYQVAASRTQKLAPGWSISNLKILTPVARDLLEHDPEAWIRSMRADYVLIALSNEGDKIELEDETRAVKTHGHLVARFSPLLHDSGDDVPLLYQDDIQPRKSCLWWRVLAAARVGPVIEIWKPDKT